MGRNEILDSIKGLAILLVVAGHCCLGRGITDFIYSFHMPVFFMVAGFLYKGESSDSVANVFRFTVKRLKRLYIPFAFWSVVLILAHNALVHVGVYNADPGFVEAIKGKPWEAPTISAINAGVGNTWTLAQMGRKMLLSLLFLSNPGVEFDGTFWFLKVLFYSSIFYCGVDWMLKKCRISPSLGQSGLILILLVVFKYVSFPWSHAFLGGTPLEPYALYHIGAVLRQSAVGKGSAWVGHPVVGFLASFAAILSMNAFFPRSGYYCYAVHRVIVSLLGLYMLYSVAILIKESIAGNMLSFLGRRTQPIMIFHFTAFRVVTLIGIVIGIENGGGGLGAFPIGYEGGVFSVAYIVVGIALPLLINEVYSQVKLAAMRKVRRA